LELAGAKVDSQALLHMYEALEVELFSKKLNFFGSFCEVENLFGSTSGIFETNIMNFFRDRLEKVEVKKRN
jgi:hypothetical protein